jgi:ceramide glucosyltransferase
VAFVSGWIGGAFVALALAGALYQLLAARLLARLLRPAAAPEPGPPPGITVLKPLHGAEPGLRGALESLLAQDYQGPLQIVFGVQNPADPAQAVVGELRRAYPDRDIALVIDPTPHGANRKIANLINMRRLARHEVLVLADSDIVAPPGYLKGLAAALQAPGVGLVTCPYHGQAAGGGWSRLAAMGLSYQFLPSVAAGVGLGLAQPSMGSTIALRADVLDQAGGLQAFADVLADDYALGAAVRAAGWGTCVAPVLVAHNCTEETLAEVVRHELRWARTVRGVDPAGFAGSFVTYPTPLAVIAVILTSGGAPALAALAAALACRAWVRSEVDRRVGGPSGPWWWLPLRDGLSFAIFMGSFFVRAVDWRGDRFQVDPQGGLRRI